MKNLLLVFLLFGGSFALAQNSRYDAPATSAPGAIVIVCNDPANGVRCTNLATTYDSAGNVCASNKQDTPAIAGSPCQLGVDTQGRVGFWAPSGTYNYTVCVASNCQGPFTVTLGGSGGTTSPGGSDTNLQYNNAGSFGGFADGTAHQLLHGGRTFGAVDLASADVTGLLAKANGGTGTATPALVAGTNITITGTWPNYTINASGSVATGFDSISSGTNTTAAMVCGTGCSVAASGSGSINANAFTGILPSANGGTANAFFTVSGPTTSAKTFTFPNASSTVLTSNALVTVAQGGTGTGSTLVGLMRGNASAMTAAELSGDATTSGSNAVTLIAKYKTWQECDGKGLGDGLNAIPAGTYLQTSCYNTTGATVTISGIKCFTDNNGSSTMAVTNGAGTALLTGAVTCTNSYAAGTQSATVTLASGDFLKFTYIADGTTKQFDIPILATF